MHKRHDDIEDKDHPSLLTLDGRTRNQACLGYATSTKLLAGNTIAGVGLGTVSA